MRRQGTYDQGAFESFEQPTRRLGWSRALGNHEIAHRSLKDTLVRILNIPGAWLVAAAQDCWEEVSGKPDRRAEAAHSFADLRSTRSRRR